MIFNTYPMVTSTTTSDTMLIWDADAAAVKQVALPYSWDGTTLTLPAASVKGGAGAFTVRNTSSDVKVRVSPDNYLELADSISLGWSGSPGVTGVHTQLFADAPGVLALRNGTNAQEFRVYKTLSDDSNKSYGSIGWDGNYFNITTAAYGAETGIPKAIRLHGDNGIQFGSGGTNRFYVDANGNLVWNADGTNDIGAPTSGRPREINVAYSINVGSFINVGDGGAIIYNDGTVLSNGVAIFNAFQFRGKSTPSSSSDSNGAGGEMWYDNDYIYLKTDSGWKRVALSTF